MDELRWILLVVGAAIVAGVYYFGKRDLAPRKNFGPRRREGFDPDLEEELEKLGEAISRERLSGGEQPATEPAADHPEEIQTEPEKIVTLYLQPKEGSSLAGEKIFAAAEDVGLSFGRFNIFHRFHQAEDRRVAVFSVANMTKPGEFDAADLGGIRSPGLCLFLALPNPLSALDAWDAMLATGKRLADLLDGDLTDESRSTLSRQRIAHIRDQMREYDRRRDLPGI